MEARDLTSGQSALGIPLNSVPHCKGLCGLDSDIVCEGSEPGLLPGRWLLFPGFVFFGRCWEVCWEMLFVTERRKEAKQDVCGGKRNCGGRGRRGDGALSEAWCL